MCIRIEEKKKERGGGEGRKKERKKGFWQNGGTSWLALWDSTGWKAWTLHVPFQCFQHFSSTHAETYWFGEFSQQVACAFTERWRFYTHTPDPFHIFLSFLPQHHYSSLHKRNLDDHLSPGFFEEENSLFQFSFLLSCSSRIFVISFGDFYFLSLSLNNSNFIFERRKKRKKEIGFWTTRVSLLLSAKQKKKMVVGTKEVCVAHINYNGFGLKKEEKRTENLCNPVATSVGFRVANSAKNNFQRQTLAFSWPLC